MSSSTPPTTDSNPPPNSTPSEPAFGWTRYAEQINGRFAMLGFDSFGTGVFHGPRFIHLVRFALRCKEAGMRLLITTQFLIPHFRCST